MQSNEERVVSLLRNYLFDNISISEVEIEPNPWNTYEYAVRLKSDKSTYFVDLDDSYVEEQQFDTWPPSVS